ncbi:MAG: hypothetical protein AB7O70_16320 [Hyphomicrobiales bacterium]
MPAGFRDNLRAYANARLGRRVFVWSSLAILLGAAAFVVGLGVGGETGSGAASSKFVMVLTFLLAIPALVLFNLALALLWAAGVTVAGLLFRG